MTGTRGASGRLSDVAVDLRLIAERMYEISVHYDHERAEEAMPRARVAVEPGLVKRMTVEPVRPS